MAADEGHGSTVTFGTTSYNANLVSIDGWAWSRDSILSSHMGTTTSHTKQPSDLADPGQITLTFQHDAAKAPPFTSTAETITIAAAGDTANTWAASGFMVGYDFNAVTGEMMEASMTLEITGDITT